MLNMLCMKVKVIIMANKILKWLPGLVVFLIILIVMLISLKATLPTFEVQGETSTIDHSRIVEIIKLLDDEEKKNTAQSELDKLYEGLSKDDAYYLASAKIKMETGNDIYAISILDNVKEHTPEYYGLRIRSAAGEYFTMGQVPNGLLNTALEAANTYPNEIDFQILAGQLYYDKNNYYGSTYYLDKALQIDEDSVEANYYYALSIYLLGEKDEGINYMKKAQSLYKGDDQVFKEAMSNYINIMKEGKR